MPLNVPVFFQFVVVSYLKESWLRVDILKMGPKWPNASPRNHEGPCPFNALQARMFMSWVTVFFLAGSEIFRFGEVLTLQSFSPFRLARKTRVQLAWRFYVQVVRFNKRPVIVLMQSRYEQTRAFCARFLRHLSQFYSYVLLQPTIPSAAMPVFASLPCILPVCKRKHYNRHSCLAPCPMSLSHVEKHHLCALNRPCSMYRPHQEQE